MRILSSAARFSDRCLSSSAVCCCIFSFWRRSISRRRFCCELVADVWLSVLSRPPNSRLLRLFSSCVTTDSLRSCSALRAVGLRSGVSDRLKGGGEPSSVLLRRARFKEPSSAPPAGEAFLLRFPSSTKLLSDAFNGGADASTGVALLGQQELAITAGLQAGGGRAEVRTRLREPLSIPGCSGHHRIRPSMYPFRRPREARARGPRRC